MSGVLNALLGSYAAGGGAFESIASTTLTSDVATYTFSNIPQTYEHLQLRLRGKVSFSSSADWWRVAIQGTSAPEASHAMVGNGSTTSADYATVSHTAAFFPTSASSLNNIFGVSIINIYDYAKTNKGKTWFSFFGFDADAVINSRMGLGSTVDTATGAITEIQIYLPSATTDLASGSTFSLYGIKGK